MTHPSDELLRNVLNEIEAKARLFTYSHAPLGQFKNEQFGEGQVPHCDLRWELLATDIHLYDQPTTWGGFFGPVMSGTNSDGSPWESPPVDAITAECIDYWQHRMATCQHPTLRAHYADLVWDLHYKVKGQRPPIDAARTAIDSYLEAVVNDRIDPPGRQDEIVNRTLYLSGTIGDDVRLVKVCTDLLTYAEAAESEDQVVCRVRDLFPLLLQINKKKRPADVLGQMAVRLRQQLDSFTPGKGMQWGYEAIAIPLADYYRQMGQRDEAITVLRCYGEAVVSEAQQAKSMLAIGWLEQVFKLYKKNEMHEDAERILRLMETRQPELPSEMATMKIPFTLPQEEIDGFLSSVLTDSLEESITNLVRCFHPRLDEEREGLEQSGHAFPLQKFFNASLVNHAGRTVARLDDDDGKLTRSVIQNMEYADVFIQFALPALASKFELTPESTFSFVTQSPIWDQNRLPILQRGIKAAVEGDLLVAIHLLVPEIESAIRNLADLLGVGLQRPHRNGGYILKNLDDLLREDAVIAALSEDTCFYFRAVLTDQRGWNLRNDVCHGLSTANSLSGRVVRRLMLIILQLSLGRAKTEDTGSEPVDDADGNTEGPETQ